MAKSIDYYMSLPYTVELEPDGDEVRSMLYVLGASYFPLRVLQEMWLHETGEVGRGGAVARGATESRDKSPRPGARNA